MDGYRESTDSWDAVFRDLTDRGMNTPKLVTDGPLAWAALICAAQALSARAKTLLHEMMEAPTRGRPRGPAGFRGEFDANYPKAVAKLDRDWTGLTAFYDFPAEHWRQLRTTNPIESSFASVKLRTRVTKRAGSRKAALAMAYKLLDAEQQRWRRFNATSSSLTCSPAQRSKTASASPMTSTTIR